MATNIEVLNMIIEDMKKEVNVATYFGYQGAAIAALAKILKITLQEKEEKKDGETDK